MGVGRDQIGPERFTMGPSGMTNSCVEYRERGEHFTRNRYRSLPISERMNIGSEAKSAVCLSPVATEVAKMLVRLG
jgi:hypothetical protein